MIQYGPLVQHDRDEVRSTLGTMGNQGGNEQRPEAGTLATPYTMVRDNMSNQDFRQIRQDIQPRGRVILGSMPTGDPIEQAPATISNSTAQPPDVVGYTDQLQLGTIPKVLPNYQVQQTDPREEQHRLWNACLERNRQLVHDTGAEAYRPAGQVQGHGAQPQHNDGIEQPIHKVMTSGPVLARPQPSTRPGHNHQPSTREQEEYLTNLASQQQVHKTTKDSMMQNIASQLQNMGLKEIRDFEASLPTALSNVRQSRRLQGAPPDTVESTGSNVEDSRLLFKGDTIYFRK